MWHTTVECSTLPNWLTDLNSFVRFGQWIWLHPALDFHKMNRNWCGKWFRNLSRMKQLHSARTSKMIDFEAKLAHFASDSMRSFVNLSPLGSSVFGRWRIVFYGLQEVLYGFIERRQPNFRLWYFSEPILAVQALTCYQKMRSFVNLSPLGSSVFGRWRIVFYGLQ